MTNLILTTTEYKTFQELAKKEGEKFSVNSKKGIVTVECSSAFADKHGY